MSETLLVLFVLIVLIGSRGTVSKSTQVHEIWEFCELCVLVDFSGHPESIPHFLSTHSLPTAGLDVSVHMKIHLVQSEEIKFETNGLHLSR